MSWYYDDDGVSSYYKWYKQAKEFEKMRKRKAKLQAKRKAKLEREKIRLKNKQERLDRIRQERELRKQKKIDTLNELRAVGYRGAYTRQNPLKKRKNQRDINLCREIYEKSKSGLSSFTLAKEYNLHPNTILRYKYEYEYILGLKGLDKPVEI